MVGGSLCRAAKQHAANYEFDASKKRRYCSVLISGAAFFKQKEDRHEQSCIKKS
jgi:hypothetical protein